MRGLAYAASFAASSSAASCRRRRQLRSSPESTASLGSFPEKCSALAANCPPAAAFDAAAAAVVVVAFAAAWPEVAVGTRAEVDGADWSWSSVGAGERRKM